MGGVFRGMRCGPASIATNCGPAGSQAANWRYGQPHLPGEGKPMFALPHNVRQRRSIAEMRCTVCGEKTPLRDRWWFKLGEFREGWFMTTEAPVHRHCGELALRHCPHLRGRENDFEQMPGDYTVLASIVGGPATERDFGVDLGSKTPVGALKLAWPAWRVAPTSPHKSGIKRDDAGGLADGRRSCGADRRVDEDARQAAARRWDSVCPPHRSPLPLSPRRLRRLPCQSPRFVPATAHKPANRSRTARVIALPRFSERRA